MAEIADLIAFLFKDSNFGPTEQLRYQTVFKQHTGLDCLAFNYQDYCAFAQSQGLTEAIALCEHDHELWLDFIFSHCIQPHLGKNALCMVYEYPACQSSLARNNTLNPLVTDRVELFINGIELGNGYYELNDVNEQNRRFTKEIAYREQHQLPAVTKDERLLNALRSGLPECSGIAIGLDRLLMLLSNRTAIADVLAFPISKA